ncbi:hypothetical protein ES708_30280 [subsurface metagenome]
MSVDFFYGAELLEELDGSFFTDAGNTGDIIRCVTCQSLKVSNLPRFDAIFLQYSGLIVEHSIAEAPSGSGIENLYSGGHQLHSIGIAGNDNGVNFLLAGLAAEGA